MEGVEYTLLNYYNAPTKYKRSGSNEFEHNDSPLSHAYGEWKEEEVDNVRYLDTRYIKQESRLLCLRGVVKGKSKRGRNV